VILPNCDFGGVIHAFKSWNEILQTRKLWPFAEINWIYGSIKFQTIKWTKEKIWQVSIK